MKIMYPDGADQEWRESLSPWQREVLATVHRQGRGLRDGTDHGTDERWRQAGVKTRRSGPYTMPPHRNRDGHTMIVVARRAYGFELVGVRPALIYNMDEDGRMSELPGWLADWRWYVTENGSQSWPPDEDKPTRRRS